VFFIENKRFLVQYFKGAALLWYLEQDIVRSEGDFEEFLRSYISKFSHRIINTDDFIEYFQSCFPHVMKVDWHSWLYTPGMPPITIDFSTKLEQQCRQLAVEYQSISNEQLNLLNANQIAYLLNLLLNQSSTMITYNRIKQMNENCHMNQYTNCEICYRWYQLCIRVQYIESLDDILKFLGSTSRMKYLKVMYSEFKSSWPDMMTKVKEFFHEHKQSMHPIAIKQIEMRI
jgi:leukotriene-A4 hydrolase